MCTLPQEASPLQNNNTSLGIDSISHCKSIIRQRNNLIINIPNNTIRITYSGNYLCYVGSTHGWGTVGALSSYSHPTICMTDQGP